MTPAERIDLILKERNLSRRKVAIKAGIPPSSFQSAMERNKNLSFDMLKKIAKALDVSVLHLLGLEEVDNMVLWRQNPHDPKIEALRQYAKENGVSEACIMGVDETIKEAAKEALRVINARSQKRIAEALKQLNAKGQAVAAERIEELTKIPEYQRNEDPAEDKQKAPEEETSEAK